MFIIRVVTITCCWLLASAGAKTGGEQWQEEETQQVKGQSHCCIPAGSISCSVLDFWSMCVCVSRRYGDRFMKPMICVCRYEHFSFWIPSRVGGCVCVCVGLTGPQCLQVQTLCWCQSCGWRRKWPETDVDAKRQNTCDLFHFEFIDCLTVPSQAITPKRFLAITVRTFHLFIR